MPDHDPKKLMRERDGLRGLVPSSDEGKRDVVYGAYLEKLGVETNPAIQQALATAEDRRFRTFLERISTPNRIVKIQTAAKQCGIDLVEFQNFIQKAAPNIGDCRGPVTRHRNHARHGRRCTDEGRLLRQVRGAWMDRRAGLSAGRHARLPRDGDEDGEAAGSGKSEEDDRGAGAGLRRTCPKCKGATTVRTPGDEHARDKVLEVAGADKQREGSRDHGTA